MMGRAVSGLITGTGLRAAPWTLHWGWRPRAARRASEPKECTAMQKLRLLSATLGLLAVASFPAEPADDIKPPAGYRHWFHVNTMIIDKGEPAVCGSWRDA